LPAKIKCNNDHIYGLNQVLENKVRFLKLYTI
jgi:hypothetical protein